MHLSDEDLVLEYYGESRATHLEECAACRERLRQLQVSLNLMDSYTAPEPDPKLEARVWAKVSREIGVKRRWNWKWFALPALVLASLLVAFFMGRVTKAPDGVTAIVYLPQQQILRAATAEHFERSQMVLMETSNGAAPLTRVRAEELISDNRLLRRSAVQAGQVGTAELLEELERVLLEIAHSPETMSQEEATALQARIRGQGLLFRVRLLGKQNIQNTELAE